MILIPHAEADFEIQNYQTRQREKMKEFDLSILANLHSTSWSMNCF